MLIKTSRFGNVEVNEEDFLNFAEGLIGFNNLNKFVLLDDPTDEVFAWLQSCDDPDIAFPVLEPELFAQNYKIDLSRHDLNALGLERVDQARCFTIVTIPQDPTQMTANLKAPILINIKERAARQCVLQDSQLAIREPIFSKLQQRVVATQPIKSQAHNWGVAVKLPEVSPEAMNETSRPKELG